MSNADSPHFATRVLLTLCWLLVALSVLVVAVGVYGIVTTIDQLHDDNPGALIGMVLVSVGSFFALLLAWAGFCGRRIFFRR